MWPGLGGELNAFLFPVVGKNLFISFAKGNKIFQMVPRALKVQGFHGSQSPIRTTKYQRNDMIKEKSPC